MNHVVFFSGGAGSYEAAKRVLESGVDPSDLHLLFTDTLIEDKGLYVLLLHAFQKFYEVDLTSDLKMVEKLVEVYEDEDLRYRQLEEIAHSVTSKIPNVHWLHYKHMGEYLSPWALFNKRQFIGNSRVAPCSELIKQRMAREYVKRTWAKEELAVYFGIDWSEDHRVAAPTKNWSVHASSVNFPLIQPPYNGYPQRIQMLKDDGIPLPPLYELGFPHNNCGGFCVRGGQGHFKMLLEHLPNIFEYHKEQEAKLSQELYERSGEKYSILTRTVKGVKEPLPLGKLQAMVEGDEYVDPLDVGGCGCFVTEEEEQLEDVAVFSFKDLIIYKGKEVVC